MKNILCSLFLVLAFAVSPVFAEETISGETLVLVNKVMQNIFDRVVFEKGKHDELADFDQKNLSLNAHQIYQIQYAQSANAVTADFEPYGFAATILPIDEPLPDDWKQDAFELGFPLLKLKFVGYQHRAINGRFDIQSAIQRYGQILLEYQQQYMPLQLSITTDQDIYRKDEEIVFTVTLMNASPQMMRIKPLNAESLYILYDGTKFTISIPPSRGDQQYINLEPGKSVSKTFHGDAFQFPREIEVYASYNMTFEGIKPFAARKIKIYE